MLLRPACAKRCTFDGKQLSHADLDMQEINGEVAIQYRLRSWINPIACAGKPNILNDKRLRMLLE